MHLRHLVGRLGIEHTLAVAIPSPLWYTKTVMIDRAGGRDFTERDRLVLDLLQPHLARLWQAARTRRRLAAALAELDRADEHSGRGAILLGLGGEVEFASPRLGGCYASSSRPRPAGGFRLPWLMAGVRRRETVDSTPRNAAIEGGAS